MSISLHIADKANPHGTTKTQLALDLVQNYPLATEAEVYALTATDRYIDQKNLAWISSAFTNYLFELGITDSAGNYNTVPIDNTGYINFYFDGLDALHLGGGHPTAVSIDASVTSASGIEQQYTGLALNAGVWTADVSALPLVPGTMYQASIDYYDALGIKVGRANAQIVTVAIPLVNFNITTVTNEAFLNGEVFGYPSVEVVIRQGGVIVYQDPAVMNTANQFGVDLTTTQFDNTLPYEATVIGKLNGVVIDTIVTPDTVVASPAGTVYWTNPTTGLTQVDFRDFADITDVGLYYVDFGTLPPVGV